MQPVRREHIRASWKHAPPKHLPPRALIGTSGWNYRHWSDGAFYPAGLKPAEWLGYYARHFDTVEINNTFYRLPERRVFEQWHDQTPDGFTFTVKASRFITHMKKLKGPEQHVALLLERAAGLRRKLGVLLFQLPPFWRFNPERLAALCAYLAHQKVVPHVRPALEVRNASWLCEECFEILHHHNVALVFDDWPEVNVQGPITADFVFLRRHGPTGLYASSYPPSALGQDAQDIRRWLREGRDVFEYFNNDAYAHAIHNARSLKEDLGRCDST